MKKLTLFKTATICASMASLVGCSTGKSASRSTAVPASNPVDAAFVGVSDAMHQRDQQKQKAFEKDFEKQTNK